MAENLASPSDKEGEEERRKTKQRRRVPAAEDYVSSKLSTREREINGIILASTKPSYCLQRGLGSSLQVAGGETVRSIHRKKLRWLLKKLLLKHNCSEASAVLSVLLKGTAREKSISKNRSKYWATLELMQHIKGKTLNPRKIQNIYDLWVKKLGPMKKYSTRDRFAVQMEFILYCLRHGNLEDARRDALCLVQGDGFASCPMSNLVVGLTYYELWYSGIPEDMQLRELNWSSSPMQSQMSEGVSYMPIEHSEVPEIVEEAQSQNLPSGSSTSIGNMKEGSKDDHNRSREIMEVDCKEQQKAAGPIVRPQGFYMKSAESSGHERSLFPSHGDDIPTMSIFYTRGLPPWLLPLKLPDSTEDLENFLYRHRSLLNDDYRNAIKYLRVALYSEPPVLEAFHPLLQLLLLGDQVKEALDETEKFSQNPDTDTAFYLRLKASLLEHFHQSNYDKLSSYFENILQKDPTCSHSLAKLLGMYQMGNYSMERLVEMIALHLDATFADYKTWIELASCLSKLSQCEEDETSTCFARDRDGEQQILVQRNRIPAIFTNPKSQGTWSLRCRWWLTRHFCQKALKLEIASGEMHLVTYKAAVAAYLYGREVKYVVKATEYLEIENNLEMLLILRMHIRNSVGFYLFPTLYH